MPRARKSTAEGGTHRCFIKCTTGGEAILRKLSSGVRHEHYSYPRVEHIFLPPIFTFRIHVLMYFLQERSISYFPVRVQNDVVTESRYLLFVEYIVRRGGRSIQRSRWLSSTVAVTCIAVNANTDNHMGVDRDTTQVSYCIVRVYDTVL